LKRRKLLTALITVGIIAASVAGCGGNGSTPSNQKEALDSVRAKLSDRVPYLPQNDVEWNNYNKAQEIYDDPTTIQWCTAFPQSSTAPIVTVPVAGKLTSSTTTAFNPSQVINGPGNGAESVIPNPSVDGLYHPNPPSYRYGFTPGGQYVDFTDVQTICTTKPLEFQRQSIEVKVDSSLNNATEQAQTALAHGDKGKAQQILEGAAGG
jgi:hypothetical protein